MIVLYQNIFTTIGIYQDNYAMKNSHMKFVSGFVKFKCIFQYFFYIKFVLVY